MERGSRTWTGIGKRIEQVAVEPTGLSEYIVTIAPRLWLLSQRTDYRIFQDQSAPAILSRLLDEWVLSG